MGDLLLPFSTTDPEWISEDRDDRRSPTVLFAVGTAPAARGRSRRSCSISSSPRSPRRWPPIMRHFVPRRPRGGRAVQPRRAPAGAEADPAQRSGQGHRRPRLGDRGRRLNLAGGRRETGSSSRDRPPQTGYKTKRSVPAALLIDRGGRVIGVAQVLNARRGSFSSDDLAELKRLCGETALAIENTSLYAQVRRRAASKRRIEPAAALSLQPRGGRIAGHAAGLRAGAEIGGHFGDGSVARRERHRQGADRARHSLQRRAQGGAVRQARLHHPATDADRERAVRARARRLHRRRRARHRQV